MEAPEKKAVPNMKQQTFSDFEYSSRKRKTRREEFVEIMDEIIPWDEWVGEIAHTGALTWF